MPLLISCSAEAAKQLGEMKAKAEANPTGANASAYNAIAKVIKDVISNHDLAFLPQHMLRGDLAGVFRVKGFGRGRVFYLASSSSQRAIILMIGYRKEGDKRDAYEVIRRLLRKGAFDAHFAELGVSKPAS